MGNQEKKEELEEKVEVKEAKEQEVKSEKEETELIETKTENKETKEEVKTENKEVKEQEKESVKENLNNTKNEEPKFTKVSAETIKAEVKKEKSKKENKVDSQKNKTNKENNTKKEKGKSKVKSLICSIILLVIALILIMAFIVISNSPEKSIDMVFNYLKIGDFQSVSKYMNNPEEIESMDEPILNNMEQEAKQLLFNKLEWKPLNTIEENNIAKVELEITNKDFKTIMSNFMKKVVKVAMTGEAISEEKQEQYLLEELKNDTTQTVTEKIEVEVEKQDGKWKVKFNENLIMSLLPGLEEAINSLETMFE